MMEGMSDNSDFAIEFTRIQAEFMAGNKPDRNLVCRVADQIEASVERYDSVNTRMRTSPDFQGREYATLMERQLRKFKYNGRIDE